MTKDPTNGTVRIRIIGVVDLKYSPPSTVPPPPPPPPGKLTAKTTLTKPHTNALCGPPPYGSAIVEYWKRGTPDTREHTDATPSQTPNVNGTIGITSEWTQSTPGTYYAKVIVEWLIPMAPEDRDSQDVPVP